MSCQSFTVQYSFCHLIYLFCFKKPFTGKKGSLDGNILFLNYITWIVSNIFEQPEIEPRPKIRDQKSRNPRLVEGCQF